MTLRIETRRSPLDAEHAEAIARLYGPADPKYRSPAFLREVFEENPHRFSMHAFAVDGDRIVGHCGIVPIDGRLGSTRIETGKYEAFVVADDAQSASTDAGVPVALGLLRSVTEAADQAGMSIAHSLTSKQLGMLLRMLGARPFELEDTVLLGVVDPRAFAEGLSRRHRAAASVLAGATAALTAAIRLGARLLGLARVEITPAGADDLVGLVRAPDDAWTIDPADSASWFASLGHVTKIDLRGRLQSTILVRPPLSPGEDCHVLAWARGTPRTAVALVALAAARRLSGGARALRVQLWQPQAAPALRAACRLLLFVPTPARTALYVRIRGIDAVPPAVNPFFYAPF